MKKTTKKVLRKFILKTTFGVTFWIAIFWTLQEPDYTEIEVKYGDNLWKLAQKYENYHHLSNEEFVRWVERRNNIVNGRIYPGEKLIIPVKKGEI
ncbi:cell division suppressor protein YneA [Parageobacillus thermoglucosidasius]|uniref:LysM peptidoglycan-binding domain-containing protein n=1 Tax=Parageobacillus thermoglucosidasius TaxID=1426 RepID=A0AB38R5X1_PARTM|nr:LysM peptidoglycan-binding domain-containing protein [Parageobacillus thermoglucosidasius]UOE78392.1 LysM peptidoglycan-binding domain-containing protein [Parageobacillus thermoglucosidasius]